MRKIVSWILLGLGAFLLVTAIVAKVWAPDQVKRAPIDTDSTTHLSGTAAVVPTGDTNVDVRAVSVTKSDSKKSTDDVGGLHELHLPGARQPRPGLRHRGRGRRGRPQRDQRRRARGVRDRPPYRRRDQRQQVPPGRHPGDPGPGQQVPVRHREEGLRVLGRRARRHRHRDVRRHRHRSTVSTSTSSTTRSPTPPPRSPRASTAPTAWTRPCGSSRRPVRSSTRSSTTCARPTARRCSTCSCRSPTTRSRPTSTTRSPTSPRST